MFVNIWRKCCCYMHTRRLQHVHFCASHVNCSPHLQGLWHVDGHALVSACQLLIQCPEKNALYCCRIRRWHNWWWRSSCPSWTTAMLYWRTFRNENLRP